MSSSLIAPNCKAPRPRSTAQDPFSVTENSSSPAQGYRVTLGSSSSTINAIFPYFSAPPTPAPSPGPSMQAPESSGSNLSTAIVTINPAAKPQNPIAAAIAWSSLAPTYLCYLPSSDLESLLISALPHLTTAQLMHLGALLPTSPRRDFLADLPPEIALHILSFVDSVKTLARASRVSRTWRVLVDDEFPWKVMCFRRGFEAQEDERTERSVGMRSRKRRSTPDALWHDEMNSHKGKQRARMPHWPAQVVAPQPFSYRKHFKTAHLTESNWRHSGRLLRSHRSQDAGVVTSLAMDGQWIVVGLANSRVHVFSASTGVLARTLIGHDSGVWSLWLVSKGGGPNVVKTEPKTTVAEEPEPGPEYQEEDSWTSLIPQSLRAGIGLGPAASPVSSLSGSSSSSSSLGDMPFQSVFDSLRPPPGDSEGITVGDGDPGARQSDPCNASRGWGQANALVISGGCDKQIRVWDVKSGYCLYILRGHRSTIRCIKMFHGRPVAVSGSRDHTLRVWDVQKGTLSRTLEGHTDSVRCLDVFGDKVVSGSYDCSVRLWNVDTGECLRVFNGHYHQVYTVAFDGERIASGGLDTTVRIWSARTGSCLALLQGHTALVCQLQLSSRTNTVITGSADGRVIIFSIAPATSPVLTSTSSDDIQVTTHAESDLLVSPPSSLAALPIDGSHEQDAEGNDESKYRILNRVSAHTSSVTGLQFDERPGRRWLVSGGNDGRVQLWEVDNHSGSSSSAINIVQDSGISTSASCAGELRFVRDLTEPCEGLWKVAFRSDLAVICCLRAGRTVLEIWSFRPVEEDL